MTGCLRFILLALGLVLSELTPSAAEGPTLNFGPPHTITSGFLRPYGLGVDETHSRLLVADTANYRFRWTNIADLTGSYTFAEHGFVANLNDSAALKDPQGIAVDAAGNVYVVNTLKGEVKLYTWNSGSYQLDPNFCSSNPHVVDGVPIQMPRDIAVGPDGAVYLLDSGNKRVLKADGPSATLWSVFKSDATWSNAYGLSVDNAGALYIADTDNHRILKIVGNTTTSFGSWGTGLGQLRFPRDVAVDQHGRIFVADTYNHRIHLLGSDGHPIKVFGHAPGIATIEKIVVDSSDRVFVVDSDYNHVLAFLGASVPAPFDPFLRDYLGDPGDEPSNIAYTLSSPDIVIRHQPDVDLAIATNSGLESFTFQQPRYDKPNYVYITVHNRGTQKANDTFVKVFWYDPSSPGKFPQDWKDTGFYTAYTDETHNSPANTLHAPLIPPHGIMVLGPLIWKPPPPQSAIAGDGIFRLGVRVTNPYDFPPVGDSTTMARDSNNVAERNAIVVQAPFPAGEQNTLMVRVHFPDLMASTDPAIAEARANDLAAWIAETSWGAANVHVLHRGPVTLPHTSGHYADPSNSLLIDMAQDILDILLAGEPNLLDGSGPGHEIGRLIFVTNDLNSNKDWATTGTWPYTVGGKARYLTVSIQGGNNSKHLFSHGLSHQLNMVDLYAHENVTFSKPYVDGWDNMAKPFNGAHPLVWSKELATWVTSHNAKIMLIPRPAPGALWDNGGQPIPLHYQETVIPGEVVGVAFGLTHGITSLNEETAFYYVEARRNEGEGAGSDTELPQTGVIMYYANKLIPQGQGPVILRDHVPGGTLNDAAIPIGGSASPAGTGIKVTVQAGTGGADYLLLVEYNPPATDYDVYMHQGEPPWNSPDIWVDNQQDGYDEENGLEPKDRGNLGIADEENRVYARVFNTGPADAFDVEVAFLFSEPYHTVDGEDAFDEFKSVFIDKLEAGKNKTRYVTWAPKPGVDPHTCARVELRRLFNDTNNANDWAQRNLDIDHSVHGSPYTSVEFPFFVRNKETTPRLFYFRVDGVPQEWTWSIAPPKALVLAGATATATLKLQPPDSAPDCTSHTMYVTGWVPQGDTLVRLGGMSVTVNLTQKTTIDLNLRRDHCQPEDLQPKPGVSPTTTTLSTAATVEGHEIPQLTSKNRALVRALRRPLGDLLLADIEDTLRVVDEREPEPKPDAQKCLRMVAAGCTDPKQPNQTVIVRYAGPDGKPNYHEVTTDENGCFEDFNVVVEGDEWQALVEYPGKDCRGPARAQATVDVPLPRDLQPELTRPAPERRFCVRRFGSDVRGVVKASRPASVQGCDGGSRAYDQVLDLALRRREEPHSTFPAIIGSLRVGDLRQILSPADKSAGFHRGRFELAGEELSAVGQIVGLTHRGSHRAPSTPSCQEAHIIPGHWELSLDGTIVSGRDAGARLHAVLALDIEVGDPKDLAGAGLRGALEAVVESNCDLSKVQIEHRIREAKATSERPRTPPCDGGLPCLSQIVKQGSGRLILDQTGRERCGDPGECRTYKSWSRLEVELKGNPEFEGTSPVLGDGLLRMSELVQLLEKDEEGAGEHAGTFAYRTRDGIFVRGEMLGITRGGTHRKPIEPNCERGDAQDHLEGRLTGVILNGRAKGTLVETRYVLQMEGEQGRRRKVAMTIDGWGIRGCVDRPAAAVPPDEGTAPTATPLPSPLPGTGRPGTHIRFEEKLPDTHFRPLSDLPHETVERIKALEGGQLSNEAERRLRIADRRFRELDRDQSGSLSATEFSVIFGVGPAGGGGGSSGAGSRFAQVSLDRHDKNKDDAVDRQEAGEGWETLQRLDANGDNRVVRSELENGPEVFAAREFEAADQNRNGSLDFTEFAVRQHQRKKGPDFAIR